MKILICENCKTEKLIKSSNAKQRFCSLSCSKKLSYHHRWKGGRTVSHGYIAITKEDGQKYEHIRKAEIALGRSIPKGVEVHHIDENPANNENSNLVLCQDHGYHRILHTRMAIVRAGGDPRMDKRCSACQEIKPRTEFHKNRSTWDGLNQHCKPCNYAHVASYRRKDPRITESGKAK